MRKRKEYLDERQQIERGKAFRNAFFTLLIASFVCCSINGVLDRPIFDYLALVMIPMWLSFSVIFTTIIMRDALFINNKENYAGAWLALIICWGLTGVVMIALFILGLKNHPIMSEGVLNMSFVQAFTGLCMIEISVAYFIKRIRDRRTAKAAEESEQIVE